MSVFCLKERILLEGTMPERALLRLRRAQIAVFGVKKVQKNQILLTVKKKDSEKVFAIYPNVCYNRNEYTPYTSRRVGAVGLARYVEGVKNRVGIWLGALAFCIITLFSDAFVLGVEFAGTDVYAREARVALAQYGIKPFSRYVGGNEDLVCAKLLSLKGVEFCSVQKQGFAVRVEMRLSPFATPSLIRGDMTAQRAGVVVAITALRGTLLKKAGESVEVGEPLVGGYFQTQEGEKRLIEPIARVCLACTYEAELTAEDAESAFAQAYLQLGLADAREITQTQITQNGQTFHVKMQYQWVQSVNF